MQTPIAEAELKILALEAELKILRSNYESKQADRIMTNYSWMSSVLEERVISRLKVLKELLDKIRQEYYTQFKVTKQFDAPVYHCSELYKLLSEILYLYKIRANPTDLSLKLNHNMPRINENMASLKNRFIILKNNLNRGLEASDILE